MENVTGDERQPEAAANHRAVEGDGAADVARLTATHSDAPGTSGGDGLKA